MTQSFDEIFSGGAKKLLKMAFEEDAGARDLTTDLLIPKDTLGKAAIYAKENGVFCGRPVMEELFGIAGEALKVECFFEDGKKIKKNSCIARIQGNVHAILKAERTVINFLGHLSGVATLTHAFQSKVKKYSVLILDTRKTLPLLREFEKYAVRTGGGRNHRMGLYDAVFVKENHRKYGCLDNLKKHRRQFEIEVRNKKELKEAVELSPRIILFDNFKPDQLRQAVKWVRAKNPEILLEASGGINLENVAHYAAMGIDWISVGALTHSVKSIDFSLLIE